METKCRFPSCRWSGDVNEVFDHCEMYHGKYVKEVNAKNMYSFTFEEILYDTFLLNGTDGLYWFTFDEKESEDCIRRGIFAIGESEICEYTTKIGRLNDGYVAYLGPFKTRPETASEYDLEWSFLHMEFFNEEVISRRMEIHFGEFQDSEEYTGTHHDVDWDNPEEEMYNNWCLEKFTCFVCFEYIRSNAKFCENRHFLCSECLQKLIEQKQVKCPMCRADFPYDCVDDDIEDLLRTVRFPESD